MDEIESLDDLQEPDAESVRFDELPETVTMTDYALEKAYTVNDLVQEPDVYGRSVEWYGFTVAHEDRPEVIVDIGLGENASNRRSYTSIDAEDIATFENALPDEYLINGWIHSHADLGLQAFSGTDDRNHRTVLEYVTTRLRDPVAKREIPIEDLALEQDGDYSPADLDDGTVTVVTDAPVQDATILEEVQGGFSYGIVVGDERWHEQEIHYKEEGTVSGYRDVWHTDADIDLLETEQAFTEDDRAALKEEVKEKIGRRRFPFVRSVLNRGNKKDEDETDTDTEAATSDESATQTGDVQQTETNETETADDSATDRTRNMDGT